MRVNVTTNFALHEPDYETNCLTLRDLLEDLSKKYEDQPEVLEFYDRFNREVFVDCEVYVNRKPCGELRGRLDSQLKEGDLIEIHFFLLSGG